MKDEKVNNICRFQNVSILMGKKLLGSLYTDYRKFEYWGEKKCATFPGREKWGKDPTIQVNCITQLVYRIN